MNSRRMPEQPTPSSSHQHHPHLPAIPDLRFEQSYLRSIRPYVEFERNEPEKRQNTEAESNDRGERDFEKVDIAGEKEFKEEERLHIRQVPEAEPQTSIAPVAHETLQIRWGKVLWITMRDQVVSPFLQGAAW